MPLRFDAIRRSARSVPGVTAVHNVRGWSLCSSFLCLTAHVAGPEMSLREQMEVVRRLQGRPEVVFGSLHATFEIEAR
jgi:Co/Zn/Cd efflux system component